MLSVTKKQFLNFGANCSHRFILLDGNNKKAWIVAAPWCITKYINDHHHLDGDKSSTEEKTKNTRTANCALVGIQGLQLMQQYLRIGL